MLRERDSMEESGSALRSALPSIQVGLVTSAADFAELRPEWNELLGSSSAGVFNSWEWLYPWHRRIAPDRELRVFTARDRSGRLLGLFPLSLERPNIWGRRVRRLSFLGETQAGSDYLDVIARQGCEEQVGTAFAAHLLALRGGWDVLDLGEMSSDASSVRRMRDAFAPDFEVSVAKRYVCPFEPLLRESFDAFLQRTARRDNYLRRRKWLEKQPGFRIECAERPGQLVQARADFFRLHALRWAGEGGSQGIRGPAAEHFHREAMELLAQRGQLRLYTLRIGDQALASVYGIVDRGVFHYFQSGANPEWRNKSVGLVLIGETFRQSLEAGLREYDFLHGTESYKFDWVHQQRHTVSMRVFRRGGPGAWLEGSEKLARGARGAVKRVLPAAWVERIRAARRARSIQP